MQTTAGGLDLTLANLRHQSFDNRHRAFCWSLNQSGRQPQPKPHPETSNAGMAWSGVAFTQRKPQERQTKERERNRERVRIGHQGIEFDHWSHPNSSQVLCGARMEEWNH